VLVGAATKVSFFKGGSEAAEAVHAAEVAIVILGNHPWCDAGWEKCPLAGEGKEAVDRKSITLEQEDLIKQIFAANPRTIVVLRASFPYAINWTQEHEAAIVHTTNSSQEEGNALAVVLFGDYNPGGRLVNTWPKSLDQLPPMMDYVLRDGRTYMYFKGEPLYPFGFGLSYTTFKYSNGQVSAQSLPSNEQITVSVDVTNTGKREGDEVVQLYVKHSDSKIVWPTQELRGFQRVRLKPGETKTVKLPLAAKSLGYFNEAQGKFVVVQEPVVLRIGSSSADIRIEQKITVTSAK
jgi:beta-glucosidase